MQNWIYIAIEGVVVHISTEEAGNIPNQVSDDSVKWADRVAQVGIRRLYRCALLGIYDEEALRQVGAALYARCVDIAAVAEVRNSARTGRTGKPQVSGS